MPNENNFTMLTSKNLPYNDRDFIERYMYRNRYSKKKGFWLALFFFMLGLFIIFIGFAEYNILANMEALGGTRYVHSLVAGLYNWGGKEMVRNGLSVFGLILTGFSIWSFMKYKKRAA
jgi:uncharacterized membrane protein